MTQCDIDRLTAIEEDINHKMTEFETNEKDALKLLKIVSVVKGGSRHKIYHYEERVIFF